MAAKLYVGNLAYETTEEELKTLFAEAGEVASVNVIVDRNTNRSKGFGFVEMASDEAAQAAIKQLDQKEVGGRKIRVSEARPQTDRPSFGDRPQ